MMLNMKLARPIQKFSCYNKTCFCTLSIRIKFIVSETPTMYFVFFDCCHPNTVTDSQTFVLSVSQFVVYFMCLLILGKWEQLLNVNNFNGSVKQNIFYLCLRLLVSMYLWECCVWIFRNPRWWRENLYVCVADTKMVSKIWLLFTWFSHCLCNHFYPS